MKLVPQIALSVGFLSLVYGIAWSQDAKEAKYADDGRQILELTAAQRTHVKEEMRNFLTGIQAMTEAFAEEDRNALKEAALSMGPKGMGPGKGKGMGQGMGKGTGQGNGLMRNAPDQFHIYGQGLRWGFMNIAQRANTDDLKSLQKDFAENLTNCSNCHATYTARDKP